MSYPKGYYWRLAFFQHCLNVDLWVAFTREFNWTLQNFTYYFVLLVCIFYSCLLCVWSVYSYWLKSSKPFEPAWAKWAPSIPPISCSPLDLDRHKVDKYLWAEVLDPRHILLATNSNGICAEFLAFENLIIALNSALASDKIQISRFCLPCFPGYFLGTKGFLRLGSVWLS